MLVNRVLKRLPETAKDLHNDMIKWSDNSDTSAWYYLPYRSYEQPLLRHQGKQAREVEQAARNS